MRYLSFGGGASINFQNRLVNLCLVVIVAVIIGFVCQDPPLLKSSYNLDNSASKIFVKVSGVVERPGIYVVADSIMTNSVIKMANNGFDLFSQSKTDVYNQYIKNGCEVKVFYDDTGALQVTVGAMPVKQRVLLQISLKVSEMNENDLLDVPGIGPGLANNIMSYRQNNGGKIELIDLKNVTGIGISKFNQLKKYFN